MRRLFLGNRMIPLYAAILLAWLQPYMNVRVSRAEAVGDTTQTLADVEKTVDDLKSVFLHVVADFDNHPISIRDVQSAYFWSERLCAVQGYLGELRARSLPVGVNKAEPLERDIDAAFESHIGRLAYVEALVRKQAASGQASPVVVSAAQSVSVLARSARDSFRHSLQAHEERETGHPATGACRPSGSGRATARTVRGY